MFNKPRQGSLQTERAFPGPYTKLPCTRQDIQPLTNKAYFNELQGLVSVFSRQSADRTAAPEKQSSPEVEWVLLKVIKRNWSDSRWTGPYRVLERTSHAVSIEGKGETWYHWNQCAAAEEPQRSLKQIQEDLTATNQPGSADPEKSATQKDAE